MLEKKHRENVDYTKLPTSEEEIVTVVDLIDIKKQLEQNEFKNGYNKGSKNDHRTIYLNSKN